MPVKTIKLSGLDWGQTWYIKNDLDQYPHHLIGILQLPGDSIKFMLQCYSDLEPIFRYDFECTTERGEVKAPIEEED